MALTPAIPPSVQVPVGAVPGQPVLASHSNLALGSSALGVVGLPTSKPRGNSRGRWTPQEVRRPAVVVCGCVIWFVVCGLWFVVCGVCVCGCVCVGV